MHNPQLSEYLPVVAGEPYNSPDSLNEIRVFGVIRMCFDVPLKVVSHQAQTLSEQPDQLLFETTFNFLLPPSSMISALWGVGPHPSGSGSPSTVASMYHEPSSP